MNITLTGNLGSGKGSVSEIFKSWGFGYISGGDLFRGVAKEKGISVIEMNELAKKDRTIDDLIDQRSTRLGDELDNTLFDSRLAWHFVRDSFKVFLLVDTDESARRVYNGNNREMEAYASEEECAAGLGTRAGLERERFRSLYKIDYYDMKNYDLIIESTNATPEEIAEEILRCFEEYKKEKFSTRVELNLAAMYPLQNLSDAAIAEIEAVSANLDLENAVDDSKITNLPINLICKNGYNFIADDAVAVLKERAAGKIFGRVASYSMEDIIGKVPSDENLSKIEKAAGFTYRVKPESKPLKHPYMMNLSL